MDNRLFFVLGDLLCNVLVGAVVGWIVSLLVGSGWHMLVAMVLMMAVGMLLAGVLWLPCSVYFGAMEVMVPLMLTGMVSGMVIGMWAAMVPLGGSAAFFVGGVCGLATIVAVWIVNQQIRGLTDK